MDNVMKLVKELQNERYRHQNVDIPEDINVGIFTRTDVSGIKHPVIVVYDTTTKDHPGFYTARLFNMNTPTNCYILRKKLEEITEDLMKSFPGMIPFAPGADDDKVILQVWM